ncbi:MAG: polyhydroxyalkanoate depolymerase, partial [Alphaproteobacteria bacterium]
MYYQFYEWNHAALSPLRAAADASRLYFRHPLNPLNRTVLGRSIAAGAEMFERATRRYGKPDWGIDHTIMDNREVPVVPTVVWEKPFCNLVHFQKGTEVEVTEQPRVVIVAPMSGHYATLLRGTVTDMLPGHDVYVTDWIDARMVPLTDGTFDLDDFVDYLIEIFEELGPDCHVMAVCQPSVPVLAALSVMEKRGQDSKPASMTLMGGPIDTRVNPTAVNDLTEHRDLDWFRRNVIMPVPFPHPGFMRMVYPGFLQLNGFMSMNLDRHVEAHQDLFRHLVEGDGDSAAKHRGFYDEYLSTMDLTAEFFLQTVDAVFIRHALPKGEMRHRGVLVEPQAIKNVALLTIEGENDDISGLGQTKAAHDLCTAIPDDRREHYMQPGVGHYGVFNGSRFRAQVLPRITAFINANGRPWTAAKARS